VNAMKSLSMNTNPQRVIRPYAAIDAGAEK
jgi:hypothetical protein